MERQLVIITDKMSNRFVPEEHGKQERKKGDIISLPSSKKGHTAPDVITEYHCDLGTFHSQRSIICPKASAHVLEKAAVGDVFPTLHGSI